jgi:DNA-binding response OmpR family regulator
VQNYNILIIDDDPMTLMFYEKYLKDLSFHIIKATSGKECFQQVSVNPFSLIILDIGIPDMDGYEIAAQLKLSRETADIPIIFITADEAAFEAGQGYELGAVDFLSKPVNAKTLKRKALVLVKVYERHRMILAELDTAKKAHIELEERLRQNDECLNAVLSILPRAVFIMDKGGNVTDCNSRVESLLSLNKGEIVSRPFSSFLTQQCHVSLPGLLIKAFSTGAAQEYGCSLVRKDGRETAVRAFITTRGAIALCEIDLDPVVRHGRPE